MLEHFKQYKLWFLLGIFIHLVAAIFSKGQLHPDEHFQILEFLGYKLGTTPKESLPWEFTAQMRPWFQPGFYYLLSKSFSFLGIENRFIWTNIFQIISAVLGFLAVFSLSYSLKDYLKERWQQHWHIVLISTLWFLPYIHARLSSEGVGSSIFTIGFALLLMAYQNHKNKVLLLIYSGVLMGISFLFRYHIGFMILPIALWGLLFKRINFIEFFLFSISVVLPIGLGVVVDLWGYKALTIAPYQYVIENLVNNKAANYGVSPWWDYFKAVQKKAIFPFGVIIILSFVWLWIKKPKSIFTWLSLPFFIVHSLIGHKEWRFLFPLANFIPVIVIVFAAEYKSKIDQFYANKAGRYTFNFLSFVMIVLLLASSLKVSHPSYDFFKFVKSYNEKIHTLNYVAHESPYNLYKLDQYYYNEYTPVLKKYNSVSDLKSNNQTYWLFTERFHQFVEVNKTLNCKPIYKNYPDFALKLLGKYLKRSKMWALYKCNG